MKKTFVKTKNVKNFVALMEEIRNLPLSIPKIALVYGEYGLGKSETIKWWTFRNDCIYVRANQGMTLRWLLTDIAEELDIESFWKVNETFEQIEKALIQTHKTIIIDEVDYLVDKNIIETLRDLHDRTGCPLVLVGMANINIKLSRYPHLMDRIYKKYEFQKFNSDDIKTILNELTEIPFTDDGLEYLSTRENQFRQIVKLLNQIEKKAKINQVKILDENTLRGLLNERTNIATLQTTKQILVG